MDDLICDLSDAKAKRVLATITQAEARSGAYETGWTPELDRAVREAFGVGPGDVGTGSEGDLARQTLLVLADDPRRRDTLTAFIEGPEARSFGVVTTTAVITAALIALQTHVQFKPRREGQVDLEDREAGDLGRPAQAPRPEAAQRSDRPRAGQDRLIAQPTATLLSTRYASRVARTLSRRPSGAATRGA